MRVPVTPPPGVNSDATLFAAPGVWNNGNNVRFYHGQPQSIGGEDSLQSGASETYSRARKLFAFKVGSTVYLAMGRADTAATSAGTGTVNLINTTDWTKANIGPSAAMGAVPERFSFAMFGDILLFAPNGETLYQSVSGGVATAVAAAPDDITAMVVTPSRQVMALGCNEEISTTFNSRCIRWSDIEDYTDWTTASSNNAGEYILPGQENIVGGGILGDYVIIWTTGTLWLAQFIGQPGQTFTFTRIDSTGLIAQDSWAVMHGTVYWMSPEGTFYGYQVGGVPFKVPCPIGLDAFETSSSGSVSDYSAVAIRRFGEVWFSFGMNSTVKAFCYCADESANTGRPVWFKVDGFAAAVDDPILADALNMDDTTSIKIYASGSTTFALKAFDKQFDGTIPAWNIETSYFYLDEGQRRVQVQKMANDEKGDYGSYDVRITGKNYPDDGNLSGQVSYTIANDTTTGKKDMRVSGRMIQAKFSSGGTAGPVDVWRMGKPVFDVAVLGNR